MNNYLIDLDGTSCTDINNEDSHLYPIANPFKNASYFINKLLETGTITYFTSREEKDRQITLTWLKNNGFPEGKLIMDKPRGQGKKKYVWIDNLDVKFVKFTGEEWTEEFFNRIISDV